MVRYYIRHVVAFAYSCAGQKTLASGIIRAKGQVLGHVEAATRAAAELAAIKAFGLEPEQFVREV